MSKNPNQAKVTKAEIIGSIRSKESNMDYKDIHAVLDAFFEEIKRALGDDRVVELRGFGTFKVRTRKGRERARNPKTGELVSVKTHGIAIFRPGKELKQISWDLRG